MHATPAEVLLAEAAAAKAKVLDTCPGPHEFVALAPYRYAGGRYRCARCGGECSGVERRFYLQGLAHGKATP